MKVFTHNNQSFICVNCGNNVAEHPTSSRNHCNRCLYSKHVDIYPGDRSNTCHGLLVPIGLEIKSGKTKIIFECKKCKARTKNIAAPDDNADSLTLISTKRY